LVVANGILKRDRIIIQNSQQANHIHSKGFFGTVQRGTLLLSMFEAIYLVEHQKLIVMKKRAVDFSTLLKDAAKLYSDFETRYTVYRDLRLRGYVVKEFQDDDDKKIHFKVYPRGAVPSKEEPEFLCITLPECAQFNLSNLIKVLNTTYLKNKVLLLGVVDEDCDITYYIVKLVFPRGYESDEQINVKIEGYLVGSKVFVFDKKSISALQKLYYGELVGKNLQISLVEAAYLSENNNLIINDTHTTRKLTHTKFLKHAASLQNDFMHKLNIYRDLKSTNHSIKTGFKYGTHFRVYERMGGLEHARYLVHAVASDYSTSWSEISRAVRVAHGVRKEFLLAACNKKKIYYIKIERIKP
jgi:tRNA-intron endonuclease